jgi:hypothetical protein
MGGRNHMLRNAALAGLGMMAYRWFRNLRFSRESAPWLVAMLRELADEISDVYGEG